MKTYWLPLFLGILLLAACSPKTTSTPDAMLPTAIPTEIPLQPPTSIPTDTTTSPTASQVEGPVVTNASDSGPGSLRQAIEVAQPHDTITFDPVVFPPDAPVTFYINSELPHIRINNLTLDASNAGVILDGSQVIGEWVAGLQIVSSEANTIMGLQISHFPGPGIAISGESKHNVIGGDRSVGAGPFGQGIQLSNNAIGIDLATEGTSFNTVTGNLIGTDLEGSDWLGNKRDGVSIVEGAHDNTIGPDNIIANNGGLGVNIEQSETLQNTITQNSIYNNGIGEDKLAAPIIFDYDLLAGTATGTACADCTVEIFSTSSDEGEIFEDQTTTDENGVFTFNKGAPFIGPYLTVWTTDTHGKTSFFSRPAGLFEVSEDSMMLQEGNDSPGFLLLPRPSQFLPDNHIGAWFEDYGRFYDTDFVYRNGFKRIRIGSLAGRGQGWLTPINSESLSYEVDEIISAYADEGVEIELILASGAGLPFNSTRFQSEEEFERYIEYVRFAVSHFKGRIKYYEIWNEPGHIPFQTYANLVERVVPVIRDIDPDAKIIIGAIQGDWANGYDGYGEFQRFSVDMAYLTGLLQSGVVDMVDGISWHPFYDNIPSDPYYQDYPEMLQGIKDLAASRGFTGEYFVDEIMWTTVDEEN